MSDDASLAWAAYALGIAALTGMSQLNMNANQRFCVSPQNSFALPTILNTNQLYQNYALRTMSAIVPTKDAVFTSNGQFYDVAFQTYINNAYVKLPTDPALAAQIASAKKRRQDYLTDARQKQREATAQYKLDTVNGVDMFTGENITLAQYEDLWYPDIGDDLRQAAQLDPVISQLQLVADGSLNTQQLNSWVAATSKAQNQTVSFPNYNMPVQVTDSGTVVTVATGSDSANSNPGAYLPAWTIGGGYNTVAKGWIDSFPAGYPGNRAQYDAGSSKYFSQNITSSANNWTTLGYSQTTRATGSSGFIFWSYHDSTTNTEIKNSTVIKSSEFGSGITIQTWGIGAFDVSMGLWYSGNPLRTYPNLQQGTPASTVDDVRQQITKLIVGYGVEVSFVLKAEAYDRFYGTYTNIKSRSGSLSIFGSVYGHGSGDTQTTFEPWDNLHVDNATRGITLRAQTFKVPQLLGVIVTQIASS